MDAAEFILTTMSLPPGQRRPGTSTGDGRAEVDQAGALVPSEVFRAAGLRHVAAGSVGRFPGTALFLDVSGFTMLSERLGQQGSAGTEELVGILNGFFGSAIDLVRGSGGEVVAFGGDAITAVWRSEDARGHAAVCGEQLAGLARSRARLRTSVGEFAFAVRIGIATGVVDVAVGGGAERLMVLTQGEAVDRAVECEHEAGPGRVVVRAPEERPGEAAAESSEEPAPFDPGRFAHPVVVERIRRGDTTLIDGHRRVTTLFVQIPATATVDGTGLDAVADSIRITLDIAADLGGEVIQITGGDKGTVALMSFGAPTSSPDDSCRAVAAGMRLTRDLPGASIGIGTGTVFAGLVGGPVRSVYTVMGDTVNLSARLMQRAEPGSVLVDEATASIANTTFAFGDWRTVHVKGKDEGVRVGRLIDQRARVWPTNRLATDGPMLGRVAQLAMAERALEPRDAGVRRVVIRGAAGIGKSRLGRALADRATARGWHVVAGGFAGFGSVAPYGGWQPVLRSILAVHGDVEAALERLLPDSRELTPLLGPLLGLTLLETARSASLEGELRNELADELAVRVIEAAARERPVMIEFEDWHWADRSSARLLDVLSTRPSAAPVTVSITQRLPLEGTPLTPHESDVLIDLDELDDAVIHDVAASVLARTGQAPDEDRIARIVELGAGNPLMIETLIDVGDEAVLTTGLAPMLQARLDGLPDADLRPLLWASAFGRPVVADELEAAMRAGDESDADVAAVLDRLVSAGLLATVRADDATPLDFRHASVREAAYQRLSHGSRRRVHHSVALAIEERDGQAVEIAHHLAQTDDVTRQLLWFPRAGTQARAAWAVDEAISWFDRARALGESSDEVRIILAELLMVSGDFDRVGELVTDPCADAAGDRRRLMLVGERAMILGANEVAVETLTEALSLSSTSGSAEEACAAGELLSRALLETGRFEEGAEVARSIVDAVDPSDHDALARAIGAYGTMQIPMNDLVGAIQTLRRAVVEAEQGEDRVRLVHLQSDLATAYAMAGDITSSLEVMFSARRIAEDIGYRRHMALSVSNEGETRLLLGDWPAVTALSVEGLRAAVALGDAGLAGQNLLHLAADPALSITDRRAILGPSLSLEEGLHRPHPMVECRTVSIELAALEPVGISDREADDVLAEARELGRPDLELRVLSALGTNADRTGLLDLRTRIDEPGDRFLVDVALRRVTGDRGDDEELRLRGLSLYRATPFAAYRAALSELGEPDPPTDVVIPPAEASGDPGYSLASVLELIGTFRRR